MSFFLDKRALVLPATLGLSMSACTTYHADQVASFDEVEQQEAADPRAPQGVQALPAEVDFDLDELDALGESAGNAGPCPSGDHDPEDSAATTGESCDSTDKGPSSTEDDPDATSPDASNSGDHKDSSSSDDNAETPSSSPDQTSTKDEPSEPAKKIDYLFVIDNSGSMKDEQQALAASAPEFIASIQDKLSEDIDVHAGVILTGRRNSFDHSFGSECRELGSLLRETKGANSSNTRCFDTEHRKYSTSSSELAQELGCALQPGTEGSGDERPIDALLAALSPELDTPRCNGGFLRDDALLVVTLVSDEEDDHLDAAGSAGSQGDPKQWTERLVALRGGNKESVVMLGLIGTKESKCDPLLSPTDNPTELGAQVSERLEAFVRSFKDQSLVGDICAPRYDDYFRRATSTVYRALMRYNESR